MNVLGITKNLGQKKNMFYHFFQNIQYWKDHIVYFSKSSTSFLILISVKKYLQF